MKLPNYVKPEPWWLWFYARLGKTKGQQVFGIIYLKRDIYNNLITKQPNPQNVGVLLHEETHLKRATRMGKLKFALKYLAFPKFHLNEELEADRVRIRYLKKHGEGLDLDRRAKALSSWVYLWCVSHKEARKRLDKIWKETH